MTAFVVRSLGGTALYQDRGRRHVASGVPIGGAFDPYAHEAATRVAGGTGHEAAVEVTGTLVVEALQRSTCAVSGPVEVLIDGRPAPSWTSLDVRAGSRLEVVARGRGYLAVAGGFQPRPVLGSRSTCLLGPIGPAPIGVGDLLPLDRACTSATVGDVAEVAGDPSGASIRVVPGPHLAMDACRVRVLEASRIGLRVRPERPVAAGATLPSLGVLAGTIQVVPSGDWFVLGPDAGTMGGYPVVGVVVTADLHRLAHMGPGSEIAFSPVPDVPAAPQPRVRVIRLGEL